jgi:NAD(P)-dependent dehydrogenase (short-subunit alcohol dehydrogenase family)
MLDGKRVVVVGASAGVGRAVATRAAEEAADVVFAARRRDVLEDAVAAVGRGAALAVDVRDPGSRSAFCDALAGGPPIDLVVVTVGVAELGSLAEADEASWNETLGTNVVGVARLLEALVPLLAAQGILAVVSSESRRRPRRDLIPYAASKAALETVLEGCRIEHPGLRVSCVVLGATVPTDFGVGFDPARVGSAWADWERHGIVQEGLMDTEDVAALLVELYASALRHPSAHVEEITIRSPSPVVGTS